MGTIGAMFVPIRKGVKQTIPIVVEFGSLTTRAGFAGEERPMIIRHTEMGRISKEPLTYLPELETSFYPYKEEVKIFNPFDNFSIIDSDAFEASFDSIMRKLNLAPSESSLLIVEPPFHNRDARLKFVQLMFEKAGLDSVSLHKSPLLTLYVYARENALILDSGAANTFVTPIVEGFINSKAVVKSDIAGEFLTRQFQEKLTSRGIDLSPSIFVPPEAGPVSHDFEQFAKRALVREIKHANVRLMEHKTEHLQFNDTTDKVSFDLPDKRKIDLSREIYDVPEQLFRDIPEHNFNGLHNLVVKSLSMCDVDVRKELLSNVFVVGGNCLVNFPERLQWQLMSSPNLWNLNAKVKVFTRGEAYERQHCNWLGGSILASMSSFNQLVMSRAEYEEHGALLIERKCYA
eukprot:TRINITY_DN14277_c0_g1_i2.p1 TRINITY_DN14277_c0_g1~~TRINITY_DN14277_c0_g1_i2.p1  ORF type:complete len:403 (-),score=65.60 TRINITY_DN14277_c0_g1_i2:189-1397(-)